MAKAKPAAKTAASTPAPTGKKAITKIKGPTPDYKPKKMVSKVDKAEIIKAQPVLYYGESNIVAKILFSSEHDPKALLASRNIAWGFAKEISLQFQEASRDQLSRLARLASASIDEAGPVISTDLTKLEIRLMGFQMTGGLFVKRVRFWSFVKLLTEGKEPKDIDKQYKLPYTTNYITAYVQKVVEALSLKTKAASPKEIKDDLEFVVRHPVVEDGDRFSKEFLDGLLVSLATEVMPVSTEGQEPTICGVARYRDLAR